MADEPKNDLVCIEAVGDVGSVKLKTNRKVIGVICSALGAIISYWLYPHIKAWDEAAEAAKDIPAMKSTMVSMNERSIQTAAHVDDLWRMRYGPSARANFNEGIGP